MVSTVQPLAVNADNTHVKLIIQRDQLVMRVMQGIFFLIPFVAGVDKFFDLLTDWAHYVSPVVLKTLPFSAHQLMIMSGPVEMIIGLLVLLKPRLGALSVAVMLFGIMINLLMMPKQLHLAFLDFSLGILALALYALCRNIQSSQDSTKK